MLIINAITAMIGIKNGRTIVFDDDEYNKILEVCDNDEAVTNVAVRIGFTVGLIINVVEILAIILITKRFIGLENTLVAFIMTEVLTTIILFMKGYIDAMNE